MILGTKSGEKKSYGPKWESRENVGTKIGFIPINLHCVKGIFLYFYILYENSEREKLQ